MPREGSSGARRLKRHMPGAAGKCGECVSVPRGHVLQGIRDERLHPVRVGASVQDKRPSPEGSAGTAHSAYRGVEFLGAYLKPFRVYMSRRTLSRTDGKLTNSPQSINSILGLVSHFSSYRIRRRWVSGPWQPAAGEGYFPYGGRTYRTWAWSLVCRSGFMLKSWL